METRLASPPSLPVSSEKPYHFLYLRDFRIEPCAAFKQHQCQQHRPFTCFNWHFANQRRRRPVRRSDGTFSYSADIYCDKYDENTGICPDGDQCEMLHRVAGDVERKYHLRYYKTALCVHWTDSRGQCAKNGAHCAFAHNVGDLRQPVFDIRELQHGLLSPLENDRDRIAFVVDDRQWHEQVHVLSCYKTDVCKKPPRLCRQGYACPFYHNAKDRRRPPAVFKYRSTPCPSAKSGDEWLEPEQCENGDHCQYCHTRTEQQFHPEIYKSTKCNDIIEHGYCPRAVFCAFAHHESETHVDRQPYAPSSVPTMGPIVEEAPMPAMAPSPSTSPPAPPIPSYSSVLKQRQSTAPRSLLRNENEITMSNSYPKAPGFERSQFSPNRVADTAIGRIRTSSLNIGQLDLGCTLGDDRAVASPSNSSYASALLSTAIDGLSMEDLSNLPPIAELQIVPDFFTTAKFPASSPVQIPSDSADSAFGASPFASLTDPMFPTGGRFSVESFASNSSYHTPSLYDDSIAQELAKAREELKAHRQKVGAWEDGLRQARQACDAWKRDAESHRRQAEQSEREKARIVMERDQAILQLEMLKAELARHGSQFEISDSIPDGPLCPRCGKARGDSRSTSTIGGGSHTCQLCSK